MFANTTANDRDAEATEHVLNAYTDEDLQAMFGREETGHEYDRDEDEQIYGSAC